MNRPNVAPFVPVAMPRHVSPQRAATPRACNAADRLLWRFPAGSYFVLSLFDRLWKKDMTEEEALQLMEKGVAEVKRRWSLRRHHSL